jgi:7 transmembrane receptor (rhodopsin family)
MKQCQRREKCFMPCFFREVRKFKLLISARLNERQHLRPGEHATQSKQHTMVRHATICSAYAERSMEAKRKVIRMLFVLVVEFFVCWTPLHVLNMWYLFWPGALYQAVGSTGVALVQLLAYCSSCCNPITYCFMNKKFRQAFVGLFGCCRGATTTLVATRGSSANESVLFEVRPTMTKSCEFFRYSCFLIEFLHEFRFHFS